MTNIETKTDGSLGRSLTEPPHLPFHPTAPPHLPYFIPISSHCTSASSLFHPYFIPLHLHIFPIPSLFHSTGLLCLHFPSYFHPSVPPHSPYSIHKNSHLPRSSPFLSHCLSVLFKLQLNFHSTALPHLSTSILLHHTSVKFLLYSIHIRLLNHFCGDKT